MSKPLALSHWRPALAPAHVLFIVVALVGITAWGSIELTHGDYRVSALWIPNAIVYGTILTRSQRQWPIILFAGWLANASANLIFGDNADTAIVLASCNSAEILIAALLLRKWLVNGSEVIGNEAMVRIFAYAICLVPMFSGLFAASWIAWKTAAPFFAVYLTWAVAHGLGMAIFTPFVRIINERRFAQLFGDELRVGTIILLLLVTIVTTAVFWQSKYPFLFLIMPALFTTSYHRGYTGAAVAIVLTAAISIAFTLAGYGPFTLIRDSSLGEQLLFLQLFLFVSFGTIFTFVVDMGQRGKLEQKLRESEALYRLLADNATDIILCVSAGGRLVYVSPSVRDRLGWKPEELMGGFAQDVIHPEEGAHIADAVGKLQSGGDKALITYRVRDKTGRYIWMEGSIRQLRDEKTGDAKGFVAQMRDISERKAAEKERDEAHRKLELLATLDGLTGLANRRHFNEMIEREWRRMQREGHALSLLMLDVDHFKKYNDIYGHQQGDICLQMVGQVLSEYARRPGDLAARYGGEEFVLILPHTTKEGAMVIARRICEAVKEENFTHRGNSAGRVTVSIGVAEANREDVDPADLIRAADIALYDAKNEGRDRAKAAA